MTIHTNKKVGEQMDISKVRWVLYQLNIVVTMIILYMRKWFWCSVHSS